ncbi:hypothetical protein SASPL_133730 [Salvia splendens]|uniref:Uncharacterized protein n=1 Tax=Salvia splendens TaxID=180675 RepID=A0A8X8X4C7_SALSN|nr:hypothetical protein SASPL_133730 [Salvia splendens]
MKKIEAESTKTECESIEAKKDEVEQTPAQVVKEAAPAMEEAPPVKPTECLAKSEVDLIEENKVESQWDMKTEETPAEAEKIEPKNDVVEAKSGVAAELVEAEAKPQTEVVEIACGGDATPKDVKSGEKDLICLSQASDGRAIPPLMDVACLGFSKDELIFAGYCILDYSFMLKEAALCHPTRQFGDEIGVHIFDSGPFDVSKRICYGTLEDLTAALSIGVHNEGEHRAG